MLQRREFIGATAAACLLGTSWARCRASEFDWSCQVISTVPQSPSMRAPVVTGVALQPASNQLAVVGDDHFISIFDLDLGRFVHSLREHRDWVRAARFSPNGQWLATAGNDRQILLWDPSSWDSPRQLARTTHAVADLAFSQDSQRLACVGFDDHVRVYDLAQRKPIADCVAPCNDMHAAVFSPDGELLISGGRSGVIRATHWKTGNTAWEIAAHAQRVRCLSIDGEGRLLSCGEDQLVRIASIDAIENAIRETRTASKLFAGIWIDATTIATAGSDNEITLRKLADLQADEQLSGHTGTVSCLDYNASRLVSGSFDTQVRVWSRQVSVTAPARQTRQLDGWSQSLK